MIAKIIGYGEDRDEAIEEAIDGIKDIGVRGVITNSFTLKACLQNKEFESGILSTNFFEKHSSSLRPYDIRTDDRAYAIAAMALIDYKTDTDDDDKNEDNNTFQILDGWRLNQSQRRIYRFTKGSEISTVDVIANHNDFAKVKVDGKEFVFYYEDVPSVGTIDEMLNHYNAWACEAFDDHVILQNSSAYFSIYLANETGNLQSLQGNALTAPMPGKIIAVNAKAGDTVKAGDPLIIMEAMKMEMTLEAPRDGVVAEVNATADALVTDGEMLLSLEEDK